MGLKGDMVMLELYANIKKRRLELNMSQQELAEAVGYKGKSMISQVEKGLVDLPESMIIKFADALHTTPATLMGWENVRFDPVSGYPEADIMYADVEKEPSSGIDRFHLAKTEMGMFPKRSISVELQKKDLIFSEEVKEAKRLYELYSQAPPEIQAAVETLLKATKPDNENPRQ